MATTSPRNIYGESVFLALLEELNEKDWAVPTQASIDELGTAVGTHLGLKRGRNEDRFAVARIHGINSEIYTAALICDGVGGSLQGDEAAMIVVSSILHQLATEPGRPPLERLAGMLVRAADEEVRTILKGKGTSTLVMFLATASGGIACVSIGDSRVYGWAPVECKVTQITTDDTVENELKNIPGDHQSLIQARGLQGRLSQAMGETGRSADELRIKVFGQEHFPAGVILGTDGLWRAAKDFESVAANARTPIDVVRRTINAANWVGGLDNSTVIAIQDVGKFFSSKSSAFVPGRSNHLHLLLWLGANRLKVVGDFVLRGQASAAPKVEKLTGKNKPKREKTTKQEPELKFDVDIQSEPRPVLEVTIGESSEEKNTKNK